MASVTLAASLLFAACGSGDDPEASTDASTSGNSTAESVNASNEEATSGSISSDYLGSYDLVDEEFGTMVSVVVDGSTRTVEANALPDHETGEFPNEGNPNTISEQDVSYEYTAEPVYTGDATSVRTTGVAVNGVKFEPGTAETVTCTSGENYRIEALQDVYNLGLDFNNAHVQPTGEYHYHGVSELLVDAYESDEDLVHVGFAADGFLMYYSKSGAYDSSYELSTTERSGDDCTASGPAGGDALQIDGTTPDGTYTSDWVFDEAVGDLDSCNGIEIDGEYVYLVTDSYPFVGRCVNGEAAAEAGGGGGAPGGAAPGDENAGAPAGDDTAAGQAAPRGAAPGGDGGPPDLTEAAETLGVTLEELQGALDGPPPDFEAAAETLGITLEELTAAMPAQG